MDASADFEYGFLQQAQVLTHQNKRFRVAQKIAAKKELLLIKKRQMQKQEEAEEEKKNQLEEEKERVNQRNRALEEAEKDAQYQALVKAADAARDKASKWKKREEWLNTQNWTTYLQFEKNEGHLNTRNKYMIRDQESGYAPVKKSRKREVSGIIQFYQMHQELVKKKENEDLHWLYRYRNTDK